MRSTITHSLTKLRSILMHVQHCRDRLCQEFCERNPEMVTSTCKAALRTRFCSPLFDRIATKCEGFESERQCRGTLSLATAGSRENSPGSLFVLSHWTGARGAQG